MLNFHMEGNVLKVVSVGDFTLSALNKGLINKSDRLTNCSQGKHSQVDV